MFSYRSIQLSRYFIHATVDMQNQLKHFVDSINIAGRSCRLKCCTADLSSGLRVHGLRHIIGPSRSSSIKVAAHARAYNLLPT